MNDDDLSKTLIIPNPGGRKKTDGPVFSQTMSSPITSNPQSLHADYFEGENEKFALTYVHGDQKIEILTSRKKLIQALAVYSPSNKLYLVNIDSELAENINGLSGKVFIDKDTKYEVFSRMEYFEQMGALLIRELKKYVFVVLPIFLLFSVALDFERENLSSKSIIEHNINEEKYNILCTENRKISKKNDKLKLSLSDGKDFYECD